MFARGQHTPFSVFLPLHLHIFNISYIFTSLNQPYPCYCSETCTEPTHSIFFVFHVAPGLCHLDYSFSVRYHTNLIFVLYTYVLKITVLCIVIHTVKNMFNLYVTLCIFDISHITIQLFTCVLSNESKKNIMYERKSYKYNYVL